MGGMPWANGLPSFVFVLASVCSEAIRYKERNCYFCQWCHHGQQNSCSQGMSLRCEQWKRFMVIRWLLIKNPKTCTCKGNRSKQSAKGFTLSFKPKLIITGLRNSNNTHCSMPVVFRYYEPFLFSRWVGVIFNSAIPLKWCSESRSDFFFLLSSTTTCQEEFRFDDVITPMVLWSGKPMQAEKCWWRRLAWHRWVHGWWIGVGVSWGL